MAGAAQFMGGAGPTRSQSRAASTSAVGSAATGNAIPAWTSGIFLAAAIGLVLLDRAKFKMVVGVS